MVARISNLLAWDFLPDAHFTQLHFAVKIKAEIGFNGLINKAFLRCNFALDLLYKWFLRFIYLEFKTNYIYMINDIQIASSKN